MFGSFVIDWSIPVICDRSFFPWLGHLVQHRTAVPHAQDGAHGEEARRVRFNQLGQQRCHR